MPDDPYLPIDAVAERLGLPLALLQRRVEAGDVPGRRVENEGTVSWMLRLGDLGVEPQPEPEDAAVATLEAPAETGDESSSIVDAIAEIWNPAPVNTPAAEATEAPVEIDITGRRVETETEAETNDEVETSLASIELAPVDEAVPPPSRADELTLFELPGGGGPRSEVAAMMLDPRELVAGLLDRWERTLEQRIYAEQRQRFQGELVARQNMVKQLQMELQAVRAEHAAAQADKDRALAEKEREIMNRCHDLDRQNRELEQLRATVQRQEELIAPAASPKRRRWFFSR